MVAYIGDGRQPAHATQLINGHSVGPQVEMEAERIAVRITGRYVKAVEQPGANGLWRWAIQDRGIVLGCDGNGKPLEPHAAELILSLHRNGHRPLLACLRNIGKKPGQRIDAHADKQSLNPKGNGIAVGVRRLDLIAIFEVDGGRERRRRGDRRGAIHRGGDQDSIKLASDPTLAIPGQKRHILHTELLLRRRPGNYAGAAVDGHAVRSDREREGRDVAVGIEGTRDVGV